MDFAKKMHAVSSPESFSQGAGSVSGPVGAVISVTELILGAIILLVKQSRVTGLVAIACNV